MPQNAAHTHPLRGERDGMAKTYGDDPSDQEFDSPTDLPSDDDQLSVLLSECREQEQWQRPQQRMTVSRINAGSGLSSRGAARRKCSQHRNASLALWVKRTPLRTRRHSSQQLSAKSRMNMTHLDEG